MPRKYNVINQYDIHDGYEIDYTVFNTCVWFGPSRKRGQKIPLYSCPVCNRKARVIISGTIPRFVHKDKKDGNFIRDVDVCEVVNRNDYKIVSVEMDKLKMARYLNIDIDTAKFSKSTQRLIEIVRKYGLNLPS